MSTTNDTLSGVLKAESPSTSNDKETASTQNLNLEEGETTIPWTIANKYYTADVHFDAHEWKLDSRLTSGVADGVPAVVFVWVHGEVCIPL